jgi:hypothetical protein
MAPGEPGRSGRDREADTGIIHLPAHALGMLAADAPRRCMPKWLGLPGSGAPAALEIPATETEPPQVSGTCMAQIQWHRTIRTTAGVAQSLCWSLEDDFRLRWREERSRG